MSIQSDFAADPIAFMNANVFIPMFPASFEIGGSELTAEPGQFEVTIVPLANARLMNPPQPGAGVYHFSLDISGATKAERLVIYWVPYQPNEFRVGMLSSRDRVMFTAAMNGCTLGIGSQPGDGSCLISHANAKQVGTEQGPAAQARAQLDQLSSFFDGPRSFSVLDPPSYRKDTSGGLTWTACNFGLSDGSKWTFWTHKYRQRSDIFASRDFFHGGKVTKAVPIPPPL